MQKVVEPVDVLPVVDGFAGLVLAVDAHVVGEEAVHADVLETALLLGVGELSLPVGAQPLISPPRADALPEHLAGRPLHLGIIHGDCALDGDGALGGGGRTRGAGGPRCERGGEAEGHGHTGRKRLTAGCQVRFSCWGRAARPGENSRHWGIGQAGGRHKVGADAEDAWRRSHTNQFRAGPLKSGLVRSTGGRPAPTGSGSPEATDRTLPRPRSPAGALPCGPSLPTAIRRWSAADRTATPR